MRHLNRRWIPCALLLAALGAGHAGAQDNPVTWHAQGLTRDPVSGVSVTNYWSQGRKMRAESVVRGHPVVTMVNGEWYYVYDGLSGTGIAVRRSARALADDKQGGRPFAQEGTFMQSEGAELVRKERAGKMACDLYRLTDANGRREACITDQEPYLPLRVEVFDRSSGDTLRTDYVGWVRDLLIRKTFFEPDPRFTFERYDYDEFMAKLASDEPPRAPILYGALLHGL